MRRSICLSEPSAARAGEVNTWKFIYTTATTLPKGSRLKLDIGSQGREIDWEVPTTNLKKGNNVIYAELAKGQILQANEVEVPNRLTPAYEFILPTEVTTGNTITFVIGAPNGKGAAKKQSGNRAQTNAQRRRPFFLSIDASKKGQYQEIEQFSIDIRGTKLHHIRVIAPSFVVKNKRFDVIVRFEDEFGNLTSDADESTLIELTYEYLRESLNWKLFIPETGFIALPNLYFNEPGVYTIQLKNLKTGEIFRSCPIKCFTEQSHSLFWGSLHGESERVDSTENIESCLRYFRDDKAYNFYATSSFENQEETANDVWKHIVQNVSDFNEDERFTTFLGFQWVGNPKEEGVRQILFTKENKQLPRKKDAKFSSLSKMYKAYSPKEIIAIPSFTMGKKYEYNFDAFAPEHERVVEIYNSWGSSECTAKEGNPCPIKPEGKTGISESSEGSIQKALQNNCRFGFVAGGLDDRDIYSPLYESGQYQYPPGITAILAKEHTRDAILEALYNRSCYATTGERILLGLSVAGFGIGKEINSAEKPGLLVNRHISGFAAGTTNLKKVEVIRNGEVIHTIKPKGYFVDFTYDDLTALEKVVLKSKDKRPPFIYYYLRVTQEDGHIAWSSPIWVDFLPPSNKPESRRTAKNAKKLIVEEDDEEEDEDDIDLFDDSDDE